MFVKISEGETDGNCWEQWVNVRWCLWKLVDHCKESMITEKNGNHWGESVKYFMINQNVFEKSGYRWEEWVTFVKSGHILKER